ncbi:MAG: endonuclease [Jatrophihabitantaceae bacterium]|nr:endonuclease [Jatrophihabitantaceae bacterium]
MEALLDAGVEGDVTPSVVVRALASIPTGPALAQWVSAVPIASLPEADLILVGAALERVRRYNASVENEVLARLGGLPVAIPAHVHPESSFLGGTSPDEFAALVQSSRADAYAAACGLSTAVGGYRVRQAAALAESGPLSATGTALAAGRLGESRARLIADRLGDLDVAAAVAIEAEVLPRAEQMTRRRLGRELDHRVAALNPAGAEVAYEQARSLRCVSRPQALPDGMASLGVTGPAEDVHLLWTAVEALGAKGKRDAADARRATTATASAAAGESAEEPAVLESPVVESIDAYRFDALIGLAAAGLADDDLPRRHGRRPTIQVTVALSTLLDLDDEPADLDGYGPIAAETARRMAADSSGTLRRLILRPDGLVIHADSQSYRPPQDLIDTIIARDRTCTFPGCSRPSYLNEIDHQISWPGGPTSFWNLHGPCKRHHRAKTAGLWTPRLVPDTGDVIWTDPYGNSVIRLAETRPIPDGMFLQRWVRKVIERLEQSDANAVPDPEGPPRELLLRSARSLLLQLTSVRPTDISTTPCIGNDTQADADADTDTSTTPCIGNVTEADADADTDSDSDTPPESR